MKKAFKTVDPLKIADEILKKGTLQLTTDQRRKMVEDKKRQVIDFISRQAVDPKRICRIHPCASKTPWSKSATPSTPTSPLKNKQKI
jgi:ribosome maturation protein SDO1